MDTNEQIPASEPHLGRLIKAELVRQGRTAVWLAKQVDCTPENLYKVFRTQWPTLHLLYKISKTLDHDFFKDVSDKMGIR